MRILGFPTALLGLRTVVWSSNRTSSSSSSKIMTQRLLQTQIPSNATLLDCLPPVTNQTRHRVYLVRHGSTDWNVQGKIQGGGYDIELNDLGKSQAALCAQQLAQLPIELVVSSHLSRAKETGDVIHERLRMEEDDHDHPIERVVSDAFGEMRFGSYEGLAVVAKGAKNEETDKPDAVKQYNKQCEVMFRQQQKDLAWPDGGESVAQVEERGVNGLKQILQDHAYCKHIVIVGHGRFNKILLSSLLSQNELLTDLPQGNTCINVLDLDHEGEGNWRPLVLNFVNHMRNESDNK